MISSHETERERRQLLYFTILSILVFNTKKTLFFFLFNFTSISIFIMIFVCLNLIINYYFMSSDYLIWCSQVRAFSLRTSNVCPSYTILSSPFLFTKILFFSSLFFCFLLSSSLLFSFLLFSSLLSSSPCHVLRSTLSFRHIYCRLHSTVFCGLLYCTQMFLCSTVSLLYSTVSLAIQ